MRSERLTQLPLILIVLATGGCSSREPLRVLAVRSREYQPAFDAAIEAAREHGMPPLVRDRRAGVIETNARIAGSLLEPWRGDDADLGQTIENTVAFQRRRCRFEFVEARTAAPSSEGESSITGEDALIDLTKSDRSLELQVSVFVERAYSPGIRRGTWTRIQTTRNDLWDDVDRRSRRGRMESDEPATDVDMLAGPKGEADAAGRPYRGQSMFWTPVYRDTAYEQRLLEDVRRKLEAQRQSEAD